MGALLLAAVAGCGGGGGGDAPATATVAATATVTATGMPSPTATLPATATPAASATPAPTETPVPSETPAPTVTPTQPLPTPTFTAAPPTERPTETPTATPPIGPLVAAVGLADTNGTFDESVGVDGLGRPVFGRQSGDGFVIFVEARPGPSGLPVATNLLSSVRNSPSGRPDLQILFSRDLGNGSTDVCDEAFPAPGGVPGVAPPSFALEQSVSDALNDAGCRFRVFTEPSFACTQDNNGNFRFASPGSTVQFCALVNEAYPFPQGDTVVAVRLRDTAGNAGAPVEIVVRIRGS